MEKSNSNTWIGVLIVVIIAGVVFFVLKNKDADTLVVTPDAATGTTAETATTTEPESVQDTSDQTTGVAAATISYANALVKYADRRIQLNETCQATPNTVTYKDNTGIMIDNRSSQSRTIKVGTTFTIKPYGFKIVILPDVYLKSKTILVDCGASQNVATILVQE